MSNTLVRDHMFRQSLIISLAYKYFVFGVVFSLAPTALQPRVGLGLL